MHWTPKRHFKADNSNTKAITRSTKLMKPNYLIEIMGRQKVKLTIISGKSVETNFPGSMYYF